MTICKFIKDKRFWGFPGGSDDKESPCSVGDLGLIPVSGRSPEEGNGNPLQYSCLENPMNKRARQAPVHGVTRVGYNLATKPTNLKSFKHIYVFIFTVQKNGNE